MTRTRRRPLPAHAVEPEQAVVFGIVLGVIAIALLAYFVNLVAAFLTLLAIAFYVFVYTILLKRTTTQNIVIGGAAGALPPVIGWAAVTGRVEVPALLLFALVFYWTPPHFWALSLRIAKDYAAAGVPMLPVVRGSAETTRQIFLYTILLVAISLIFFAVARMGLIYLVAAVVMGALFLWQAGRLARTVSVGGDHRRGDPPLQVLDQLPDHPLRRGGGGRPGPDPDRLTAVRPGARGAGILTASVGRTPTRRAGRRMRGARGGVLGPGGGVDPDRRRRPGDRPAVDAPGDRPDRRLRGGRPDLGGHPGPHGVGVRDGRRRRSSWPAWARGRSPSRPATGRSTGAARSAIASGRRASRRAPIRSGSCWGRSSTGSRSRSSSGSRCSRARAWGSRSWRPWRSPTCPRRSRRRPACAGPAGRRGGVHGAVGASSWS